MGIELGAMTNHSSGRYRKGIAIKSVEPDSPAGEAARESVT